MIITYFAAADKIDAAGSGILVFRPQAFVIQIITFILVFVLLKKFAFNKIVELLNKRHKIIEDGVRLGRELEAEKRKLDQEVARIMREARHEADKIIATGQKEARELTREAEKVAKRKTDAMIADAEVRIQEDTQSAKRKLEKDIINLISDATEAIVGEKVDTKKDAELIKKVIHNHTK